MKQNREIKPKSRKAKAHGGARSNAGRKKGAHNKRTEANVALAEAQNITPLGFILAMLNDLNETQENRKWAAKEGLAYTAARLTAVDATLKADINGRVTIISGVPRAGD